MARSRLPVSTTTLEAMAELRSAGASQRQIAETLGLSRWVVRTRLHESGPSPRAVHPGQSQLLRVRSPAARRWSWPGCASPTTPAGIPCRYS